MPAKVKGGKARAPRRKKGEIFFATRLEVWPIERLRMFHHNPREHNDEQVDAIMRQVADVGFLVPPIVDQKRGRILAGNGRYMAALRLGMTELPVIPVGHLSRRQQVQFVIADNRLGERSSWRREFLAEHLAELEKLGADLAATGFTVDEVEELLAEFSTGAPAVEKQGPPPVPDVAATRPGDLWILGNHRVLCGDATSVSDLGRLMGGRDADAVWTDPPYNVDYEGSAGKIKNDAMTDEAFAGFLGAAFRAIAASMRAGAPIYVAHPDTGGLVFRRAFVDAGFHLSSCLIWRKNALVLSRGDYHWQHEPILYGWKQGAAHRWHGARDKTTILEFDEPPFVQTGENEFQISLGEVTLLVSGAELQVEALRGTVFLEDKPAANPDHPTMKPVPLIERMLLNSTRPGRVVLDPFGGSGSTLVACERNGLIGRLLELDPKYCDVIVERWQNLTSRKATLKETGRTFDEVRGLG